MTTSKAVHDSAVATQRVEEQIQTLEVRLGTIENPELVKAAEYLLLREELKLTMQQVAERWGYKNRSSIHDMVNRWKQSGVLDEARQIYLVPKQEEIQVAYDKVLALWPDVIRRQVETAISGRAKVALEAAAWLHTTVVLPELAKKEDAGAPEQNYANKTTQLNPTDLSRPTFLPPTTANKPSNG